MKVTKTQLKQIIKEELESIQKEGFMDKIKDTFGSSTQPAMKGFNQGPSKHTFAGTEQDLQKRKKDVLDSLAQTRTMVTSKGRGTFEKYFFGQDAKTGMIDTEKMAKDIESDLAGIDSQGYTYKMGGELYYPDPIEIERKMADFIGNPFNGWKKITKYLNGGPMFSLKDKDVFAVQQAYAADQLRQ